MILLNLFTIVFAAADMQGILPGESDPNAGVGRERIYKDGRMLTEYSLDDRKCPKGKRAYLKMKCGTSDDPTVKCEKYSAVIECLKKQPQLECKTPKTLVPVLTCD